jgi:two-component system nitrate/nitrite sensor histidine kinase NarX
LDQYYHTLSEAYQDARQAIDGLRIGVGENGVQGWLDQLVADFQETAGLPVTQRHSETAYDLPQEVHAQLIRIVQEAFSNIRKHANASHVWVNCVLEDGQVLFEIQDDGDGFAPEDISGPSRHGLRGMRERADLIGADLQVVSRPSEGTIIRIHLPMSSLRVREDVG